MKNHGSLPLMSRNLTPARSAEIFSPKNRSPKSIMPLVSMSSNIPPFRYSTINLELSDVLKVNASPKLKMDSAPAVAVVVRPPIKKISCCFRTQIIIVSCAVCDYSSF